MKWIMGFMWLWDTKNLGCQVLWPIPCDGIACASAQLGSGDTRPRSYWPSQSRKTQRQPIKTPRVVWSDETTSVPWTPRTIEAGVSGWGGEARKLREFLPAHIPPSSPIWWRARAIRRLACARQHARENEKHVRDREILPS